MIPMTENQVKAFEWWDSLSINEMKFYTGKYFPGRDHNMLYKSGHKYIETMYNSEQENIPDLVNGKYRYILKGTGESSGRYGACEVCKDHCTEVFYQVEEQEYQPDKWTRYECHDLFGHKECLESKQR